MDSDMTETCLYAGNHTRVPTTPAAFHIWADRMKTTHTQTLCPGCNLWVIWKPNEKTNGDVEESLKPSP